LSEASAKTCSKLDLQRDLSEFQIDVSPLNPSFQFAQWLSMVDVCKAVKDTNRRQVYYLRAGDSGYFLKHSSLVRSKDRRRHFLLPFRRWSEWRNLHRLRTLKVPAARPLARGQSKRGRIPSYFILTEQVPGTHIPVDSLEHAHKLGSYAAFLHRRNVYHADLNRKNFLLEPSGELILIDAQEVYFPPWLPRGLKIHNLGRLIFHCCSLKDPGSWVLRFLEGYNRIQTDHTVNLPEAIAGARRHRNRHYRSRTKRCCKNSSEFERVKFGRLRGYKRRDFTWEARDLEEARENGKPLKGSHVIGHQGVCIKTHAKKLLHLNRCLASWKMSRALEVRGITVPRSLAYYEFEGHRYYLAELLNDRFHLNAYLSELTEERLKRQALKKLALWLRSFHDMDVWQRDFKSSNIICRNNDYYMVDLDGVRIRHLKNRQKIYNLAQLNASVSNAVTIKDRLRFYHYYSAGFQSSRQERRAIYREVWDITLKKNTKIYDLDFAELIESQVKAGPAQIT
jgi:tRNA A-37 threonylcarbamoyl transferase component Bud32